MQTISLTLVHYPLSSQESTASNASQSLFTGTSTLWICIYMQSEADDIWNYLGDANRSTSWRHMGGCLIRGIFLGVRCSLDRNALQEDSSLGFFPVRDVIHSMSYYHVICRQFHTVGGIPLPAIMTVPKARVKTFAISLHPSIHSTNNYSTIPQVLF